LAQLCADSNGHLSAPPDRFIARLRQRLPQEHELSTALPGTLFAVVRSSGDLLADEYHVRYSRHRRNVDGAQFHRLSLILDTKETL
jgi:hypothetical protein